MALSAGDQLLDDHLSGHSTGQGNSKGRFSIVGQHCLPRGGPITWGSQLSVFHSAAPHRWRPVLGVDKQSSAPGVSQLYSSQGDHRPSLLFSSNLMQRVSEVKPCTFVHLLVLHTNVIHSL